MQQDGAFTVRLPLLGPVVPGFRCIPAGRWGITPATTDPVQRLYAVRGTFEAIERRVGVGEVEAAVQVDQGGNITVQVFTVPLALRGAYAQAETRRTIYGPARRRPTQDLVLFEAWGSKSASDNPGSLLQAAVDTGLDDDLVVAINDESVPTPRGARRVVRWTPAYYQALGSARLIVANDSMAKVFVKRPDQNLLQTWHGTPLKRVGFDVKALDVRQRAYQESLTVDVAGWDWLLSSNPYSTEVLRKAFRFDGPVWETGYPRNDALVAATADATRERVRQQLGIPAGTVVILWAPTWRDDAYGRAGSYALSGLLDVEGLAARLPPTFWVMVRAHHLVTEGLGRLNGMRERLLNVSQYPDVNDLYLASDVLVTDYSSAMFDYAVTGKPILLYVPDLARYRDVQRGLYLDLEEIAPGPVVTSDCELLDLLTDLPQVALDSATRHSVFRETFCSLEDGHSAERVWELLSTTVPRRS